MEAECHTDGAAQWTHDTGKLCRQMSRTLTPHKDRPASTQWIPTLPEDLDRDQASRPPTPMGRWTRTLYIFHLRILAVEEGECGVSGPDGLGHR